MAKTYSATSTNDTVTNATGKMISGQMIRSHDSMTVKPLMSCDSGFTNQEAPGI